MEPFGLFDLLKTLLPMAGTTGENVPTPPSSATGSPTSQTEKIPPAPNETVQGVTTPNTDALRSFLQSHEQMSNRVKRK